MNGVAAATIHTATTTPIEMLAETTPEKKIRSENFSLSLLIQTERKMLFWVERATAADVGNTHKNYDFIEG